VSTTNASFPTARSRVARPQRRSATWQRIHAMAAPRTSTVSISATSRSATHQAAHVSSAPRQPTAVRQSRYATLAFVAAVLAIPSARAVRAAMMEHASRTLPSCTSRSLDRIPATVRGAPRVQPSAMRSHERAPRDRTS
jgi:hypothetical protein